MKHGNSQNGKLPIFRERLRELQGDLSIVSFADKLNLSRQTVGFYLNGDRIPDALTLAEIAKVCGVSSDYLLGLSDTKCIDTDMKAAMEYTGLSQSSIEQIKEIQGIGHSTSHIEILDWLLSKPEFNSRLIGRLHNYQLDSQGYFVKYNTYKQQLGEDSAGVESTLGAHIHLFDVEEAEDYKELALFKINKLFAEILDDFITDFCDKERIIDDECLDDYPL